MENVSTIPRDRSFRRRGSALLLLVFLMGMFAAIATLAVDYGHIQLLKTEMQRMADATARGYIEYYIIGGQNYANTHGPALYSRTNNPVDGTSGVAPTVNVTWGYWTASSGTFSTSSGAVSAVKVTVTRTSSGGNAVPLFWGGMIGILSSDVHATAIAAAQPASLPLVGLNSVSISGASCVVDSYESASGIYSTSSSSQNATVASNGNIALSSGATVEGNATPGVGCGTSLTGGSTVTGSTSPLTAALNYSAATLPGSYTNLGSINYTATGNMAVAAGTYYCTGLTVSGTGTFSINGPTIFYVNGPINITGSIQVLDNLPQNLVIYATSSNSVTLGGNTEVDAYVDAPLSDVTVNGSGCFSGGIIGKTLTITNSAVHNDLSGGGSPSVSLVQ